MSSFSSPEMSDTKFRLRMAARRRAKREQERQTKVWETIQTKRRGNRIGAGRAVIKDIMKERKLLRMARDAADETLKKSGIKFADENCRNYGRKTQNGAASSKKKEKSNGIRNNKRQQLPKICRTPVLGSKSSKFRVKTLAAALRDKDLSSPGNRINYKQIRKLGRGSFGTVIAAKNLDDGNVYALKTICYRGSVCVKRDRERALQEVHALRRLSSHCCIVSLHDAFESADKRKLHIVAEFCESGSLESRIDSARRSVQRNGWAAGKISERIIQSWIFQLCSALEHLHKHNTLHRDLKPANIFLCNGGRLVKLGDFGLVNVLENSLDVARSHVGTPCYNLTPELLRSGGQGKAADMWSLGVCLIECCTLEQPFMKKRDTYNRRAEGGEMPAEMEAVRHANANLNSIVALGKSVLEDVVDDHPRLASYSQALTRVCSHNRGGCLCRDPSSRPTATELLETPYFVRAMNRFLKHKDHLNACPQDLAKWIEARVVMAKMSTAVASTDANSSNMKQTERKTIPQSQ